MALRMRIAVVVAALVLALGVGASRADAAIPLGSPDPGAAPTRYVCCPSGTTGYRQLALLGATVHAPDAGVLVSASVYARRLAGTEPPRVVVLRPAEGITATVVASAPLPVSSTAGALHEVRDLHLPVEEDDSLGIIMQPGEVQLGVRNRPTPDGAVVLLTEPCSPCGANGGTGRELLLGGTLEPDEDLDGLGDETQDPDGGGFDDDELLGPEDDLEFFEEEFDEEFGADEPGSEAPTRAGRLQLLGVRRGRRGRTTLVLAVPGRGRLTAAAATRARRRGQRSDRARVRELVTVATGRARTPRAGLVQLRLRLSVAGRRLLSRRGVLRTRLEVVFRPVTGRRQTLTRELRLGSSRAGERRRNEARPAPPG